MQGRCRGGTGVQRRCRGAAEVQGIGAGGGATEGSPAAAALAEAWPTPWSTGRAPWPRGAATAHRTRRAAPTWWAGRSGRRRGAHRARVPRHAQLVGEAGAQLAVDDRAHVRLRQRVLVAGLRLAHQVSPPHETPNHAKTASRAPGRRRPVRQSGALLCGQRVRKQWIATSQRPCEHQQHVLHCWCCRRGSSLVAKVPQAVDQRLPT